MIGRNRLAMDRLWDHARRIKDEHAVSMYFPKFEALAIRGDVWSMLEVADQVRRGQRIGDAWSGLWLCYLAYRRGEPTAAQHLAMKYFNAGDMNGYRHWLRRAANAGDEGCFRELRRFETRLPHETARKVKRLRPARKLKDGSWE